MSGSITVGGKILASHDNVGGKLSMSENVDMSNMVFPAGHVIQTSFGTTNTEVPITGNSAGSGTDIGLSATITPNSTNNKLIISASFIVGTGSYVADPGWGVEIYDGTSVVATDGVTGYYFNGDGNEYYRTRVPFYCYINPASSGTPIDYSIRVWRGNSAYNIQANQSGGYGWITIQEIQQ